MPKRTDISSILIIGAGPIVIGQACEFDYSGAQACKALKAEGYRVILVNSNPATIMTDPGLADATYIEPITAGDRRTHHRARKTRRAAADHGRADRAQHRHAARRIRRAGAPRRRTDRRPRRGDRPRRGPPEIPRRHGRDRHRIAAIAPSPIRWRKRAPRWRSIGLPAVIRPSFTLGGTGGGIAYNREEFEQIVAGGLDASPTTEVLIEESVLGWKEFEMEVVRDRADNCIIVCSIENVDPMGIHTGDSVTVAPALTLTDKEYQRMRDASIACLRAIGVDTGGSNVQFAVNPADGRMVIIEMNPRVSRSSALASKATGFPIAKIAAKLAVGYTLDELANDITRVTPASFEPTIDYVVVKIPRFTFEKFPGTPALLTTIDEIGRRGDGDRPQLRRGAAKGPAQHGDRIFRPRRDRAARRWRPGRVPRRTVRTAPRPAADGRAGVARRAVGRGHPRRQQVRPLVPARTGTHRRCRTRRSRRPACRMMPARCAA